MKHYGEIYEGLRDADFEFFNDSELEEKFKKTGRKINKRVTCIMAYRADHNLTVIFENGLLAVVGCDTCQIHCDDLKIGEDYAGKTELKLYKNGDVVAECLMDYLDEAYDDDEEEEEENVSEEKDEPLLEMGDIVLLDHIEVGYEGKEKNLFTRNGENDWHYEHWDRKGIWSHEEEGITDEDVYNIVNDPDVVRLRAGLRIRL